MKVRFYLFDSLVYTDTEWSSSNLPKKGDEVYIHDFINHDKKDSKTKSNVFILDKDTSFMKEKNYDRYRYHKDRSILFNLATKLKEIKNMTVSTNTIWRKINDELTPCYCLISSTEEPLIDPFVKITDIPEMTE